MEKSPYLCGQINQQDNETEHRTETGTLSHASHGRRDRICTILNTYVEENLLDEKGKPDYAKLKPVLFEMPTYKYLRTGDVIGDCVKMGKAYGMKTIKK